MESGPQDNEESHAGRGYVCNPDFLGWAGLPWLWRLRFRPRRLGSLRLRWHFCPSYPDPYGWV